MKPLIATYRLEGIDSGRPPGGHPFINPASSRSAPSDHPLPPPQDDRSQSGVKGIIALDIDGTITTEGHSIPGQVVERLSALQREGWSLLFVTGRTYAYGYQTLKALPVPFFFSCYNGAVTLQMPEATVVQRHYLSADLIPKLVESCAKVGFDPLIHTGVEFGDYCYYRPSRFSREVQEYLERRREATRETWVAVQGFGPLKLTAFAYAKVFGPQKPLYQIQREAEGSGLAASLIRDPLWPGNFALLITHPMATKGGVLRDHRKRLPQGAKAIAAGDDENDLSMLKEADIAIAMGGAPESLRAVAAIQAPPATEFGILAALKEAIG
ncbi:MAG: HAD family hydrolase [Parachlamydiales bacterium]